MQAALHAPARRYGRRVPVRAHLLLLGLVPLLIVAGLWATLPRGASSAPGEGELRDRIERGEARERALGGAVARLDALVARAARQTAILEGRLAAVQADLDAARGRLAQTLARERAAKRRLARLRARFRRGQAVLARQLVASFKGDRPDVVSVVLGADSFGDLIARAAYARRVRERSARIVDQVRVARAATRRDVRALARLAERRREDAAAIARRRSALGELTGALRRRRDGLAQARAVRATALAGARAGRRSAQGALDRLVAARAAAARREAREAAAGGGPSGGPWAIPWAIVQCESGGQNLPPNAAGASGYYQFLPSTWRDLGGSTPHAYQASRAEQDRLAARLWAGGAGARNWVCAALVD